MDRAAKIHRAQLPVSEGSTSVRIRSIKTKPLWTPSLASLAALETFKQAFLNMNITMGKSGIVPSQVGSAASLCDTSPLLSSMQTH